MANQRSLTSFNVNFLENSVSLQTAFKSFNCVTDCIKRKSSAGSHFPIDLATFNNGGYFQIKNYINVVIISDKFLFYF
jgi:hypothetical protein